LATVTRLHLAHDAVEFGCELLHLCVGLVSPEEHQHGHQRQTSQQQVKAVVVQDAAPLPPRPSIAASFRHGNHGSHRRLAGAIAQFLNGSRMEGFVLLHDFGSFASGKASH
jgi:hypothetical protein